MKNGANQRRERVGWDELGRWVAPWLLGALLAAVALLGLFAASRAADDGACAIGLSTAALALLALAWMIRRAGDGAASLRPLPLLVEDATALVIVVALLALVAVLGLVLAARSGEATLTATGYALFGFGLVFIFWNLKHYFDVRERRPPR